MAYEASVLREMRKQKEKVFNIIYDLLGGEAKGLVRDLADPEDLYFGQNPKELWDRLSARYKKTDPADIQDKVKELNDFLFTSRQQYAGQCVSLDSKTKWLKDHRQAPDEYRLHQIVKDALVGPKQTDSKVKKA